MSKNKDQAADLKRDKPIRMGVQVNGDHVELMIGTIVLGLDPAIAQELAEKLLAAVGKINGDEFLMVRGFQPKSPKDKAKEGQKP